MFDTAADRKRPGICDQAAADAEADYLQDTILKLHQKHKADTEALQAIPPRRVPKQGLVHTVLLQGEAQQAAELRQKLDQYLALLEDHHRVEENRQGALCSHNYTVVLP